MSKRARKKIGKVFISREISKAGSYFLYVCAVTEKIKKGA